MADELVIRMAGDADLPAILAIYNDAVLNTTAIWNDDVVDLADRAAWLAGRQAQGYPVLVALAKDRVLGYGTYGAFRPHQGYRLTVENSIYVAAEARGQGAGAALLGAVIDHATAAGKHVMIAAITAGNAMSIRLHARQGFTEVGRLDAVGVKFGRPLDLILMRRQLTPVITPPA